MTGAAEHTSALDLQYLRINFHEAGLGYLVPEILQLCQQQARLSLEVIRQGLDAGDPQAISAEAHNLKGTAGTCGAHLLAEQAWQMEQQALTIDPAALQELVAALETAVELTGQTIDEELERLKAANQFDLL